ncbi:MAG: energy transducer TonB [Acidobacteriota bacterium]
MKFDFFENKPELLKHGLSLAISLVIHAVVIYLMAAHFVSVKIINFKEKVTPVLIAPPPPRLEVPEAARRPAELPVVVPDFPDFIPTRTLRRTQPSELQMMPPSAEAQTSSRIEAFEPKFSSGFRLDRTEPEKPGAGGRDRLRLTIPERSQSPVGKTTGSALPPKDVDWRKYLSAGAPGAPGAYYGAARRRGGRSSLRAARISAAELRKYNLSPWASKVVELIQKNWDVPLTRLAAAETIVEIVVVIQKTGEISAIQVLGPSDDTSFDRAARLAIEASSPVPALPTEFPGGSLEISFVFSKK